MSLNMKNKKNVIFFMLAIMCILSGCANETSVDSSIELKELPKKVIDEQPTNTNDSEKDTVEPVQEIEKTEEFVEDEKIKQLIQSMTLEEKVGQMFIVEPEVFSDKSTVTEISEINLEKVKKYNVGGFIMFGKNIINPIQITEFNEALKNVDETFFISVDEEGGTVSRISSNINFPDESIENMSEIGANNDTKRADEVGEQIGAYLNKYGFNLDFAPLCDVLVNDQNTVVRDRSFGKDKDVVADLSLRIMTGLRNNKILATAKHFPGHGSTSLDTHDGFATSDSTLEEMKVNELVPFENMIANGVDMMMVSHVIYSNITKEQTPASMNYEIVTGLLKEDMGYNGVIITDAMNMGAIYNNYSVEESTINAVLAGIDIILVPSDFYRAYDSIINAVKSGEISEERIDESVYKILKLKNKM